MSKVKFCEKYIDVSCQYSWSEGIINDEKSTTLSCKDNDFCDNMIDSDYILKKM